MHLQQQRQVNEQATEFYSNVSPLFAICLILSLTLMHSHTHTQNQKRYNA